MAAPLPTGTTKATAVREMFDTIAGRYEILNTVISLGMDRGWRLRCVEALAAPPGSLVLDMACGTGSLMRQLRREGLRPIGLYISVGMLTHAGTDTPLVLGDALCAPLQTGSFDAAVSGFALRNVVDLSGLFVELARVVRPGGRISLLELGEPEQAILRLGHRLWCSLLVPGLGALLSNGNAYRYLPASLAYLPCAGETTRLMREAGFVAVEHELLSGGISQLYVGTRRQ